MYFSYFYPINCVTRHNWNSCESLRCLPWIVYASPAAFIIFPYNMKTRFYNDQTIITCLNSTSNHIPSSLSLKIPFQDYNLGFCSCTPFHLPPTPMKQQNCKQTFEILYHPLQSPKLKVLTFFGPKDVRHRRDKRQLRGRESNLMTQIFNFS